MVGDETYEKYPLWIPLASLLQTLAIYGIGLYVFSFFGQVPVILYLLYIIWLELHVMDGSCRNCFYYGKLCGIGRGKLCGLLMKRDAKDFGEKKLTWKDLVPDFLAAGLPLAAGIILLTGGFDWTLAALLLALILLATAGNGIIRGIVCAHCKQRKIGCPAEQMFQKK